MIKTYKNKYNNKYCYAAQYTGTSESIEDIKSFYNNFANHYKIEDITEFGNQKNLLEVKLSYIRNNEKEYICQYFMIGDYIACNASGKIDGYSACNKPTFENEYTEVEMDEVINIYNEDESLIINKTNIGKISILGTEYKLFRCKEGENGVDSIILGLCDRNLKQIRIVDTSTIDRYKDTTSEWKYINELNTLKHEIVHAYLTESGLNSNTHFTTCWAEDEEIVDWIAWQTEKIVKSFNEVNEWLKQFFVDKENI